MLGEQDDQQPLVDIPRLSLNNNDAINNNHNQSDQITSLKKLKETVVQRMDSSKKRVDQPEKPDSASPYNNDLDLEYRFEFRDEGILGNGQSAKEATPSSIFPDRQEEEFGPLQALDRPQ